MGSWWLLPLLLLGNAEKPLGDYEADDLIVDAHSASRCSEDYADLILSCWTQFNAAMMAAEMKNWCQWTSISRIYSDLTECTQYFAQSVGCFWPNPEMERFFLHIHSEFFSSCPRPSVLYADPPAGHIVALTLAPVCLIPPAVALVIWRNRNR